MSELELEEILDFRTVVSYINLELKTYGIYNIEYLLINNSIEDVFKILEENSKKYDLIKNDKYSNGGRFKDILEAYFMYIKRKYDSLFIYDGKNADKYYSKLSLPVKDKNNDSYLQYSKSDINMIQTDVEKTLMLMREAIIAYYNVYHNRMLIAELSSSNISGSDYLEFRIKEEQLLHLLGVTSGQLKNNPDFIRLTGKRNMNSIEILEWILSDLNGNNDLLQLNEDFLKRMYKNKFLITKEQFDKNTTTLLLNYHKIRIKSQTFLKYGPLEKVSLVAKLQNGKSITKYSNSNTVLITRAESLKKYPWAYFGSVQTPNEKYIETLVIDNSENKKKLLLNSQPAIVKGVYNITEDDSGGVAAKTFSEEEQFDLFCKAYESFQYIMDFRNLKEYFHNLYQTKGNFVEYKQEKIKRKK